MKRIEFIPGILAMRGNVSGNQSLQYALHNNPAWDAPDGRQYAKNYTARYIGAKRAKDGLVYFCVKTKSASTLTAKSRLNMALTAGVAVIRTYLMNYQTANYLMLQAILTDQLAFNPSFSETTFNKWFAGIIRNMLSKKQSSTTVVPRAGSQGLSSVTIYNPWVDEAHSHDGYNIAKLAKFWMQLANDAIKFSVGGKVAYAKTGSTFGNVIEGDLTFINILGLTQGTNSTVKYGELFVLTSSESSDISTVITNGTNYELTDVDPGGH